MTNNKDNKQQPNGLHELTNRKREQFFCLMSILLLKYECETSQVWTTLIAHGLNYVNVSN
jgi:hypothetical protein